MSTKKNFLITVAALLSGCLSQAQEAGNPILTDTFDSQDKLAENWTFRGKPAVAGGKVELAASEITLNKELPAEYVIECDVTLDHDMTKPAGFAGMLIGPCRFQVKPEGTSFLLWPDFTTKKNHGTYKKIEGFKLGSPVKLTVVCTVEGDAANYSYFINGTLINSFRTALPEKDKNGKLPTPFFTSWRVDKLTVDNFKLSEVKKGVPAAAAPAK